MHASIDTSLPAYHRPVPMPKWNGLVTVTQEPRAFKRLPEFAGWTKAEHLYASETARAAGEAMQDSWHEAVNLATARFGSHGSLISGVYRDHFPESVKAQLRTLAQEAGFWAGVSLAHWIAGGRRVGTWRNR